MGCQRCYAVEVTGRFAGRDGLQHRPVGGRGACSVGRAMLRAAGDVLPTSSVYPFGWGREHRADGVERPRIRPKGPTCGWSRHRLSCTELTGWSGPAGRCCTHGAARPTLLRLAGWQCGEACMQLRGPTRGRGIAGRLRERRPWMGRGDHDSGAARARADNVL